MKTILTGVLFFVLTGIVHPQTLYDIGHATLSWTNVWIKDEAWIDPNKTFPSNVIYCNEGEPDAIAYSTAAPRTLVPLLEFIKKDGEYTCQITVVSKSGAEIGPSPFVTFLAAWLPHKASDLKIIIVE